MVITMNNIQRIFKERDINIAEFARDNDLTPTTLYAINNGKTQFEKISAGVFVKIAEGLGMSVEELYYGKPIKLTYSDPCQNQLNESYELMTRDAQKVLADAAALIADGCAA